MDLAKAKLYMKIDIDDDNELVTDLIEFATEYLKNSTGSCDETKASVRITMLGIMSNLYDNRDIINEKGLKQYILDSSLLQQWVGEPDIVV